VSRYENYSDAMDHVWEPYQFDFGIVWGDFNLPNGPIGTQALNMMVLLLIKFVRSMINTKSFTLNKKIMSLIHPTLSLI
jgi:hypothetical protein